MQDSAKRNGSNRLGKYGTGEKIVHRESLQGGEQDESGRDIGGIRVGIFGAAGRRFVYCAGVGAALFCIRDIIDMLLCIRDIIDMLLCVRVMRGTVLMC